jgi:hypothetical protein
MNPTPGLSHLTIDNRWEATFTTNDPTPETWTLDIIGWAVHTTDPDSHIEPVILDTETPPAAVLLSDYLREHPGIDSLNGYLISRRATAP